MNSASNEAMIVDPDMPPSQGAFPVWSRVYTQPKEQTFIEITEHPEAKAKAAYIWVFLAGTLSGLVASMLQFIVAMIGLQAAATQYGGLPSGGGFYGVGGLLGAICSAPLTGLFSMLGFMISTAIVHATAKFFGGQGTFDKLAYAFGAIAAPATLVSALMIPLNVIPFGVFCTLPVFVILGVYILFLEVTAIKAVHKFGWGESAAALFLPTILLGLLCGVLALGLMRLVGPSLNDILEQMRQLQQLQ